MSHNVFSTELANIKFGLFRQLLPKSSEMVFTKRSRFDSRDFFLFLMGASFLIRIN